jgi:hypothetical protein
MDEAQAAAFSPGMMLPAAAELPGAVTQHWPGLGRAAGAGPPDWPATGLFGNAWEGHTCTVGANHWAS